MSTKFLIPLCAVAALLAACGDRNKPAEMSNDTAPAPTTPAETPPPPAETPPPAEAPPPADAPPSEPPPSNPQQ